MVVSNIGIAPSISAIYSPNAAQDSGFIQVELKSGHRHPTKYYVAQLKQLLPMQLPDVRTLFSSGSIIDSVLNLGMMAPIDVQFAGSSFSELNQDGKGTPGARLIGLPQVSQSFIVQESDYPTLNIQVDRVRAARLGVKQQEVISNVITALDSNLYIKPSIWIDHANKDDYFLTVQYPGSDKGFDSVRSPAKHSHRDGRPGKRTRAKSVVARRGDDFSRSSIPSEADHYSIQRVVDLLVAPSTEDLGGTQEKIQSEVSKMTLPPGVSVKYRGAVASMQKSFSSFGFGLSLAVILLYLVMVAQFRSFLDPLIIMFAVPMGLIGVIWTLWLTGTTLNIESFMGIIVMVGIVVSNSILLVDFANERRRQGQELRRATVESARIRMRPILMTALATVAGLMPIAMKLGEGSEASAPLARAAVGGLIVSTVLTLFLVPCIYEFFYRRIQGDGSGASACRELTPMFIDYD